MPNIGNWIRENCSTIGLGDLILTGAATTAYVTWAEGLNGVDDDVWYSILDGKNRESGIGTFDGINTITRDTINFTIVDGVYDDTSPTEITLTGNAIVSCTLTKAAFDSKSDDGHTHGTVVIAPVETAIDKVLTVADTQYQVALAGVNYDLPDAQTLSVSKDTFIFDNKSQYSCTITTYDTFPSNTIRVHTVPGGTICYATLMDNSTEEGEWGFIDNHVNPKNLSAIKMPVSVEAFTIHSSLTAKVNDTTTLLMYNKTTTYETYARLIINIDGSTRYTDPILLDTGASQRYLYEIMPLSETQLLLSLNSTIRIVEVIDEVITFGTTYTITGAQYLCAAMFTSIKGTIAYTNATDKPYASVIDINAGAKTIAIGTPVQMDTADAFYISNTVLDTSRSIVMYDDNNLRYSVANVSGAIITPGADTALVADTFSYAHSAVRISDDKIVVAYKGDRDPDDGGNVAKMITVNVSGDVATPSNTVWLDEGFEQFQLLYDGSTIYNLSQAGGNLVITKVNLNGSFLTVGDTHFSVGRFAWGKVSFFGPIDNLVFSRRNYQRDELLYVDQYISN